jgi:hypothetical protein
LGSLLRPALDCYRQDPSAERTEAFEGGGGEVDRPASWALSGARAEVDDRDDHASLRRIVAAADP